MRIPIAYAMSYPERLNLDVPRVNLFDIGTFTFEEPDVDTFPCLRYAYKAGEIGGTMPAVLNAANEIAVDAFLRGEISFLAIPQTIKSVMDAHEVNAIFTLDDLIEIDRWARTKATDFVLHNNNNQVSPEGC
jgi:1-deoxy-D-xylulose-5-phosphate reductoisomerase